MLSHFFLGIGPDTVSTGLTLGALYALIAVGLTMVYGMLRILHIAHAAVLVLGAYAGFYTWSATGSFWLGVPLAMVVAGLANVVIYFGLYRWIIDEEPLIPLIASIGLFVALSDGYRLVFGAYEEAFSPEFAFSSPLPGMTTHQFVVISLTVVLFAGVYVLVKHTRTGLAWQVTAQDRETAGSIGINVRKITALNFLVGGMLAGAAGALVGMYHGSVSPHMGNVWAYKTFIVIVLGGMGSIPGTIIAAFVLGLFETSILAEWGYIVPRDAIAFSLMVFALMFKPEGLMGGEGASITRFVRNSLNALRGEEREPGEV